MRLKLLVLTMMALFAGGTARAQEDVATPLPIEQAPAAPAALVALPPRIPENTLALDLSTGGRVLIQLRPDVAPGHVERIRTLARQGFYNGIVFHRVIEGFMAQTGDPQGTGEGGSPLPNINAEFSRLPHMRGAVSMARANETNSANSQFFIMLAPRLTLDGNYSVFGRVVEGMQYVDAIPRGEPPANPARIIRASIEADNVPPPTAAEIAAANQPRATSAAASAIDAALAAEGSPPPPPAAAPADATPPPTTSPPPQSQAVEAMDAAAESQNAAQNDTGTAADPTAQPPPPTTEPADPPQ